MICDEKKRFKSEHAATTHLRMVQGKKRNHIGQHAYLCDGAEGCYFWHLTSEFDHPSGKKERHNKYHGHD